MYVGLIWLKMWTRGGLLVYMRKCVKFLSFLRTLALQELLWSMNLVTYGK